MKQATLSLAFPPSCQHAIAHGQTAGTALMLGAVNGEIVTTSQEALAFLTTANMSALKTMVDWHPEADAMTTAQKLAAFESHLKILISQMQYALANSNMTGRTN